MVHIVGVSVCLMGVGCLVWAGIDDNNDPMATGNYRGECRRTVGMIEERKKINVERFREESTCWRYALSRRRGIVLDNDGSAGVGR